MNKEDVRIIAQLKDDIAKFQSTSEPKLKRFMIRLTSKGVVRMQFLTHSQSKIVVCQLFAHHAQLFIRRSDDIESLYKQALDLFYEHRDFLKAVEERSIKLRPSLADVRYIEEKLKEYSRRYFTKKDFHNTASSKKTLLTKDFLTYGKIFSDRSHKLDFIISTNENVRVLGALLTFDTYPIAYLISDSAEEIEKFASLTAQSHRELLENTRGITNENILSSSN